MSRESGSTLCPRYTRVSRWARPKSLRTPPTHSEYGALQRHFYPSVHQRQNPPATDLCYKSDISSLMEFSTPDSSLDKDSVQL
nr:uncharacterized protein LOC111976386 isoform X2 [Salvelinus alpinus]